MKLNNFDIKNNFWEVNSNFLILGEFKQLYEEDKSKNKEKSSNFMWALSLLLHPDSILYNISSADRRTTISREYLHDSKFDWKKVVKLETAYQRLTLSPAQRQLLLWNRFMDEKTEYMNTLNYQQHGEIIEKLLLTNSKLIDEYEKISERLEKEGNQGVAKGGAEESASEKGMV